VTARACFRNKNLLSQIEWRTRKIPLTLQAEAAECGLACLSMIASFHGFRIDLPNLRARFPTTLRGATLAQIVDIAGSLGLSSRAIRLEIDELRNLALPCILHWDLNHYVVLDSVSAKGIVINDPATGRRTVALAEVGSHFTGVALELLPTISFRHTTEVRKVSIRLLLGKTAGIGRGLAYIFLMALCLEGLALVAPLFNQWVVDEALISGDKGLVTGLTLGFAILLVIQTGISIARSWTVVHLSTNLNLQWIANVFAHLLRLPTSWFEGRHLGDIVSKFGAINTIQGTITNGFVEAVLDGLMAILTGAMMIAYSGRLSAVVVAAVVLYACLRIVATKVSSSPLEHRRTCSRRSARCRQSRYLVAKSIGADAGST
jgi:ATP-binding cassette, subfamily B, bacterial CvaB/MchF/RaxB